MATVREGHSFFFFSSRRRHTRLQGDWSSDVCSSDLCFNRLLGGLPHIEHLDIEGQNVTFGPRSEEHTSELQSPCNLVCRLLLEKKKNDIKIVERLFDLLTKLLPSMRIHDYGLQS